ncbi:hypothetical protein [Acetobacter thailandicus]|uniref:hypothetical protein n=1 Tax=Acetobacter thailandicus TaxID=1502842 RepID=UPI001BA6FBF0|nr:hypothetical protein [Acetobacter thailandicus]MBS0981316.1 hypothetical protein [Acetobacter thailandicus]
MLLSKIIEIDGVFLGTAVFSDQESHPRFYAAHESVRGIHDAVKPDFCGLFQHVARQFRCNRFNVRPA